MIEEKKMIVQIFYDYECPFCRRGYEALIELLPKYPIIAMEWKPVESHPRPEEHHPHTDLCVQSFYIAQELGADLAKFHKLMFQGVSVERQNVEKPELLYGIVKEIIDREKFMKLLESGKYANKAAENNDLAYEKEGVWYVPSFRCGKLKLDAQGGMGVTKDDLKQFLDKASN